MIGHRNVFIFVLFFGLMLPSIGWSSNVELTLDEAIRLTLENNPELMASKNAVKSADAARKQARGHYGPTLSVSSNVMVFDEASALSLSDGSGDLSALPAPATPYEMAFVDVMEQLSEPTKIQDQVTSETQVTVAMPLNQLYQIHQGYKVASLNRDVAQTQSQSTRQNTILQVVSAYFQVLQAQAQLDTAQKSVDSLNEQARVVKSFVDQGLLARNDQLKVRVALADADRRLILARSQLDLARTNLVAVMGVDMDADYQPAATADLRPAPPSRSLPQAIEQGLAERQELAELRLRDEQADRGRKVAIADMFPNLALVGAYKHTEGIKMGKADAFFGGLTLEWTAWEWGSTFYGIEKARQTQRQLEHLRQHAERMIGLEIRKARIDVQTAFQTLEVTEAALTEAEESFQIEAQNLAQGMGTIADTLDSEAALAKARNNHSAAVHQCFIAKATFLKAIGEPLDSIKLF